MCAAFTSGHMFIAILYSVSLVPLLMFNHAVSACSGVHLL